jgi:cytochrome b
MGASAAKTEAGGETPPATVRVWDPLVRIFHWSLVGLFAFAFVTGDEWDKAHETAGYIIAGLVAFRVVWGLIGPRHARFTDFVRGPGTIFTYLRDALAMKAPRHIGHNPAGGAMIVLMLLALSTAPPPAPTLAG